MPTLRRAPPRAPISASLRLGIPSASVPLPLAIALLATAVAAQEAAPAGAEATAPAPVVTPPQLVEQVEPEYPPEAFEQRRSAEVVVRVTIDETGAISDVEIDQGAGHGFDESSLAAARKLKFTPALVDGVPASVQILFRFAFAPRQAVEEVPVEVDEAKPTGSLGGLVLERGTRKPLAGFTVRLPERGLEAYTDEGGRFDFTDLEAGVVAVELDDDEYYTLEDTEEVTAGELTELKYYVERRGSDSGITVVGRRVRKEVARRTLTMEEIRSIPGTSGDAIKVVQNLPGVARIPFGGGGLVVRGSNPGDSGALIDRHWVPLVFHFGGLRSIFPSELLESIEFYPGNFGSEFGRFSGGVVDVRIRRPKDDAIHGHVQADVFDAGFLLEGPGHPGGAFAIAARRSYIDLILPAVLDDDAGVDFSTAPRWQDYQAIYDWKAGNHTLRGMFFGSQDAVKFLIEDPVEADPAVRGEFRNQTDFWRLFASWDWRASEDVRNALSVSFGKNEIFFGVAGGAFGFENEVYILQFREDLEVDLTRTFKLRVGVDTEAFFGSIFVDAPAPPKEGDNGGAGRRLTGAENITIDRDFTVVDPGAWVEGQLSLLGDDLLLVPGVRFDYESRANDWSVDPRLAARYELFASTTVKGGVGLFMNRPSPDENDEDFGNPDLGLERIVHYSGGVEQRFGDVAELDVVGFYKQGYDLVTRVEPEDDSQAEQERAADVRYLNQGESRIYGLEVLLKHDQSERFFGWISYTLMRSERKDEPGDDFRLFDLDQTHIFTILGQYRLTSDWSVGGRWRYVTGNPQTPLGDPVYDATFGFYDPRAVGGTNSDRLPAFHQLDVRGERRWTFDTWRLVAYLELQNAYNRQNPETLQYNYDYSEHTFVTGLPIIPSFGIRGEF